MRFEGIAEVLRRRLRYNLFGKRIKAITFVWIRGARSGVVKRGVAQPSGCGQRQLALRAARVSASDKAQQPAAGVRLRSL